MSFEEKGMYMDLLMAQHQTGRLEKDRIRNFIGIPWEGIPRIIREKFAEDGPEYVYNERLEFERQRRAKFIERSTENGRKGGAPKKQKTEKETEKITQNGTQTETIKGNVTGTVISGIVLEKEGGVGETVPDGVVFLYDTPKFKQAWDNWVKYRKDYHSKKYDRLQTEMAFKDLGRMATDEDEAIGIIERAIANNWENLYGTTAKRTDNVRRSGKGAISGNSLDNKKGSGARKDYT